MEKSAKVFTGVEFLQLLTQNDVRLRLHEDGTVKVFFEGNPEPSLSSEATVETATEKSINMDAKIVNILHTLQMPSSLKGYHYLKSALLLTVQDIDMLFLITKTLYPTVAKKHVTTPSRVERAIRHAKEIALSRTSPEVIEEIFGYTIVDNNIPNGEFISMLTEYLKLNC